MKHIKTAATLICALLMLGGCDSSYNGGDHDLKAQLDLLQSQYERLSDENAELREENGKLIGAKESAEEELVLLQKENSEFEAKANELEKRVADLGSIVYNGGGYRLRYLGDECDAEGRVVLVLSLIGAYIPYIRVDTKATELFSGIMVLDGTYEFANENIDENGYLYLISPIVEEDKLPFRTEKYIKLRFIDSETGQYTMFDKTLYNDSYTHNVGFNGNIVISTVVADENGNARYYDEGTVLNVQGGSALVLFDGEKTE